MASTDPVASRDPINHPKQQKATNTMRNCSLTLNQLPAPPAREW